jgi:hypothetical protein
VEAERQQSRPLAVGEKSKVPNADKASWQHMEQKTAQELVNRQGQQALFVFVGGVPPAKGDSARG